MPLVYLGKVCSWGFPTSSPLPPFSEASASVCCESRKAIEFLHVNKPQIIRARIIPNLNHRANAEGAPKRCYNKDVNRTIVSAKDKKKKSGFDCSFSIRIMLL